MGLGSRFRKTVTLSATRESFTFATSLRAVTIECVIQVGANGRILGFGRANVPGGAEVIELFPRGGAAPDESAVIALCRRGLSLALGPWIVLRPRMVVHCGDDLAAATGLLERALRAAGASTVDFVALRH